MPNVKPLLKWAGGKGRLLDQMNALFPKELRRSKIKRYCAPFVGSGAVLFYIAQTYDIQEFLVADLNEELILAYRTIKVDVEGLIDELFTIQQEYFKLDSEKQKQFFYNIRSEFNAGRVKINFSDYHPNWITRTAQLIFLNRTCFNGLFRVNAKAEFNVPLGRYKNPKICAAENLRAVSGVLQRIEICEGDFAEFVDSDTFVYFDLPYRLISKTSSFTS